MKRAGWNWPRRAYSPDVLAGEGARPAAETRRPGSSCTTISVASTGMANSSIGRVRMISRASGAAFFPRSPRVALHVSHQSRPHDGSGVSLRSAHPRHRLGRRSSATAAGMTAYMELDQHGHLMYSEARPPQLLEPAKDALPADWAPLFTAAGLDPSKLQPAERLWTWLSTSDVRTAWTGTWPISWRPMRVEAAALRGKPVGSHVAAGYRWSAPWRTASPEGSILGNLGPSCCNSPCWPRSWVGLRCCAHESLARPWRSKGRVARGCLYLL